MSKMPAKKKSCFQITSVTTAQAASSITEDTESLDDPDESRTEDVSSEIFDVSRATDYGPEEEEEAVPVPAAGERSSSEETLNNVGEAETPGTVSPNVPGRAPGPQPPPPAAACSSRFRVIKLDHGSGEPYRRGRWTCTEFYDKEPDSSGTVLSRASDTIRHTSSAYEHSADRDSGLGGSHPAPDSIADSMAWQQQQAPPLGGALSQGHMYPPQQMMVPSDPAYSAPQNVSLAPSSVTSSQTQQFSYPPGGHLMSGQHAMPAQKTAPSPSSLPGQFIGGVHPKPSDSGHAHHIQPPPGTISSTGAPLSPMGQQQVSGIRGHAISPVPSNAIPVTMPIPPAAATFVQSPLSSHTSVSRSNSLIPNIGLPPLQGTTNAHAASQFDDRRKSEPLPQPTMPLTSDKPFVKVPMVDPLTNPLHLPVFGLPLPVDGEDDSSSSANVVAIDNKIEQAMDLVKSHLMYAVREEVEVLREQIKELIEKNSTLERENALLKSLSSSDQLSQLSPQAGLSQPPPPVTTAPQTAHPPQQPNVSSA